jgi:hypothetical protein
MASATDTLAVGDFDGDGRADVLQHGAKKNVPSVGCGLALRNFVSFGRFRLSSAGERPFATWSAANMR